MAPPNNVPELVEVVDLAEVTLRHGRYLRAIAYRMLGCVADAEDAVQEALARFAAGQREEVRAPRAFLARTVARICIDQLKSARVRREAYVGPWLPEPWYEDASAERADEISMALMLVLERLSPLERAAFLLHDVMGVPFEEVGSVLKRSPAACRKLSERGRLHVTSVRPRFESPPEKRDELARSFFQAVQTGDSGQLARLLADDAVLYSDGGGKRQAARKPVLGSDRIARFLAGITRRWGAPTLLRHARLSGSAGVIARNGQGELYTLSIESDRGAITAVHIMRNPEKLGHIEALFETEA